MMSLDEMVSHLETASLHNFLPREVNWGLRRLIHDWRKLKAENERLKGAAPDAPVERFDDATKDGTEEKR